MVHTPQSIVAAQALLDRIEQDNYESPLRPPPIETFLKWSAQERVAYRLFDACRTIVARSKTFEDIINELSRKDEGLQRAVDHFKAKFFPAIEINGSVGYNYLNGHNCDFIKAELLKDKIFSENANARKTYERLEAWSAERFLAKLRPPPAAKKLFGKFSPPALEDPYTTRLKEVRGLFETILENARRKTQAEIIFFEDWVPRVKARLEKPFRQRLALLNLENWIRIYDGLWVVVHDPTSLTTPNEKRQLSIWTRLHDDAIKSFVASLLPPAPSTQKSIEFHRRIGLRRAAALDDIDTRGTAVDGGLVF